MSLFLIFCLFLSEMILPHYVLCLYAFLTKGVSPQENVMTCAERTDVLWRRSCTHVFSLQIFSPPLSPAGGKRKRLMLCSALLRTCTAIREEVRRRCTTDVVSLDPHSSGNSTTTSGHTRRRCICIAEDMPYNRIGSNSTYCTI